MSSSSTLQEETGVKPAWAVEAFDDLDEDVRQSIARIQASPLIPHRDSVRGFIYDVRTGQLREVSPARAAELAGSAQAAVGTAAG